MYIDINMKGYIFTKTEKINNYCIRTYISTIHHREYNIRHSQNTMIEWSTKDWRNRTNRIYVKADGTVEIFFGSDRIRSFQLWRITGGGRNIGVWNNLSEKKKLNW